MSEYDPIIVRLLDQLNKLMSFGRFEGLPDCAFEDLFNSQEMPRYFIEGNTIYLGKYKIFSDFRIDEIIKYLVWAFRMAHGGYFRNSDISIGSADQPFNQEELTNQMRGKYNNPGLWWFKSARGCREHFISTQAKKASMGRRNQCSPGLEKEINRIVRITLEDDLGL